MPLCRKSLQIAKCTLLILSSTTTLEVYHLEGLKKARKATLLTIVRTELDMLPTKRKDMRRVV